VEDFSGTKLVRRIRYGNLEKVDGIWTPRSVEAFDAARNSRTLLKIEKLQYNAPMKDEDFTVEALRRAE
jgi:hypothetical protein